MGPTTLFDKSFLQSLSEDESVLFDHFFIPVICPLFYIETLADLEKAVREGRTPEQEVGIIARKTPQMSGAPCVHHTTLSSNSLMGQQVPLDGRIPTAGGKPVKVDGRSGVRFDEAPEAEAFRRWQCGEFLEVELSLAKDWRDALNEIDLKTLAAGMRVMGVNAATCKSLQQARDIATEFVGNGGHPVNLVKFALVALGLPDAAGPHIDKAWQASGYRPIAQHAPFAAHVLSVEVFFQVALAANLIGTERPSNRTDVGYLFYLPFCMVFVSSDRLHQRTAQHFLRDDQSFVWGPDLKADLGRLVQRYRELPLEERERGIYKAVPRPPEDPESLVTCLWTHHFGLRRREAAMEAWNSASGSEKISRKERPRLPTDDRELVKALNRFGDAPELPLAEVDFDTTDPQMLSIKRAISPRKGSFWQLPKDLKRKGT